MPMIRNATMMVINVRCVLVEVGGSAIKEENKERVIKNTNTKYKI